MIKNKIVLIFIFITLFTSVVFSSYTVTEINILKEYGNDEGPYHIDISFTGDVDFIPLRINSDKSPDWVDFNAIIIGSNVDSTFYIDFDSSANSVHNIWPKIIVNSEDEIVVEHLASGLSDSMIVDIVSPVYGDFDFISLGTIVDSYYKGDVNISISNFEDNHSGINKYIIYIVEQSSNINNFKTNYVKKIDDALFKEDPAIYNLDILNVSNKIPDGNYYVLLDVKDNAENSILNSEIINNKKHIFINNDPPQVSYFNLGDYEDDETYYVSESVFLIDLEFSFSGIGVDESTSQISIRDPDDTLVGVFDYNVSNNGFYVSINEDFNSGEFSVSFNVSDLLGNLLDSEFTISIDNNPPTAPASITITRNIEDDITIAWGISTPDGSDIKKYEVYRDTATITNNNVLDKTLICTVLEENTRSCIDTTSKSSNQTYHYAVVAIDMAGNVSPIVTDTQKTGPSISIDMDFDYSTYVKSSTPKIKLEYSSNVSDVRLSCNGTTFSSWIEVSGTSREISNFSITSGNGCNTDQGNRTLYVEARDEDDNTLIRRKSFNFRLDTVSPTVPTPTAVQQSDGSIKVSWNASSDAGSGVLEYFVYYSQTDNVSETSQSHRTGTTQFIYKPNIDQIFYFKVLAVDRVGNKSALSSTVSAESKRYGPLFTFNVTPKNELNDVIFLKRGLATFSLISDEALKEKPTIKLNKGQTLVKEYALSEIVQNNLVFLVTYDFNISGDYTLKVTGTNIQNQTTVTEFDFIVDASMPTFDYSYFFDENTKKLTFTIDEFSEDVFRIEFILNNNETICFLVDLEEDEDIECVLDTLDYSDGNYNMYIYVYDQALNYITEIYEFEINNVDEDYLLRDALIKEINENKLIIENRINFLNIINIAVSQDIITDFNLAKEKIIRAKQEYEDDLNIVLSNQTYTLANNLLLEILTKLPKENEIKKNTFVVDFKDPNYDLNIVVLDANITKDTVSFYDTDDLNVFRELKVFEISGENYYSSTLIFENTSNQDIIISFVEFIPTDFARRANEIYFQDSVQIISDNPVVLYNITIPKNSTYSTRYIRKKPITSLDVITQFDRIVYKNPLLLKGNVSLEQINIKTPLFQTRTLLIIAISAFVFIVFVLILFFIFSANKNKKKVVLNLSAKDEINKYLGSQRESKYGVTLKDALYKDENKSNIEEENKHENNYDFILESIKRGKK